MDCDEGEIRKWSMNDGNWRHLVTWVTWFRVSFFVVVSASAFECDECEKYQILYECYVLLVWVVRFACGAKQLWISLINFIMASSH